MLRLMSLGSRRSSDDDRSRSGRGPQRAGLRPTRPARLTPESGPRILFLCGGTALRGLSRALKQHTHHTTHLVTPFDSGGSSAPLRSAFRMPSVGDLRNRLLALADESSPHANRIHELLHHRLDREETPERLLARLADLVAGRDPLIEGIPEADARVARKLLACLSDHLPDGFDLRGASLGNLLLAGGYLENRNIEAAIESVSALLGVRGHVLPTANVDLHLAARLADGTRVIGQHRLTGKEHPPLSCPIEDLWLVENLDPDGSPVAAPAASTAAIRSIREAELICYPMGSFYSSVLCNLLPAGIGRAIAETRCPKVYVPSTGHDPELVGLDPAAAAANLIDALRRDAGEETPVVDLLDRIVLDENPQSYEVPPDMTQLEALGIEPVSAPLVSEASRPDIDPERLADLLLNLCANRQEQRP